tara:strand:+ start:332 stop:535 length:204 start_codon:yes stop_codon:yes gene_type:complete
MNVADLIAAIPRFPDEYKDMRKGELSKRQIELLDGADIKSNEGMIYGAMYRDWKVLRGFEDANERSD